MHPVPTYVRAYVEFIHYVERLYEAGAIPVHGHFATHDNEGGSPRALDANVPSIVSPLM